MAWHSWCKSISFLLSTSNHLLCPKVDYFGFVCHQWSWGKIHRILGRIQAGAISDTPMGTDWEGPCEIHFTRTMNLRSFFLLDSLNKSKWKLHWLYCSIRLKMNSCVTTFLFTLFSHYRLETHTLWTTSHFVSV